MRRKRKIEMVINKSKIFVLALILGVGFVLEANAQISKGKINPRRTTTARPTPTPPVRTLEPEVISRAEDELREEAQPTNTNAATGVTPVQTQPAQTPRRRATAAKKEAEDAEERSLRDLERLTLAEERAGILRKQLEDVIDREATLRSKLELLDYQGRTEVIERETAVIGSTRPELERENRKKLVDNEKKRVNDQLTQVVANRTRLENAVTNADLLVERLRLRVDAALANDKKVTDTAASKDSDAPNDEDNNPDEDNLNEETPNFQ